MPLNATLQFRTTLDQAGRVAGLAGELEIAESEVLRMLLDRALDVKSTELLSALRAELGQREREREQLLEQAEREGAI
jgi:hypothetical protein